jgi:hypothetical protein
MRSSTFDSKHPALFYSKLLMGFCALVIVTLELTSNFLLEHHSETYARVSRQYAAALTARPAKTGKPTSVLMVGNSLLLYGVDVNRLRALTSDQLHIYPVFLEATGYYDWLYGLRRLFRDGARPQVVVLGVGINEFFSDSVRPDYAPMMLFDGPDTLSIASDLKLNRTDTADLLLAHFSVFWDVRNVIRLQILSHMVPHCKEFLQTLKSEPPIPPTPEFGVMARSRLERLRELCEAHGAKLILLVPPAPSSEGAVRRLVAASNEADVATLVPIDPRTLPTKYYLADDIHLNPEGAELFTSALATSLPGMAASDASADPN